MFDEALVLTRDIMTRDVAVVDADAPLLEAVRLMARRRISGLPVTDAAGKLVGILSEGDLVRWHEGLSERQARWLDKLAEGYDLAPGFLAAVQDERP
jgi:CBS-domain-containing membrane protein